MKLWEMACVACGVAMETCLHLLHVKTGIHIPHPEGIPQHAINYLAVRR